MLRRFLIVLVISVLCPINSAAVNDAEALSLLDAVSWLEKEAHRIIRASQRNMALQQAGFINAPQRKFDIGHDI